MATAQAQIIAKAERRRSERQPLALPLVVRGIGLDTRPFTEETFTLSVSANGALLALATTVTLGQALFLRNAQTQEEAGSWVTRFGLPRGGVALVGVEFVRPDADFWPGKIAANSVSDSADRQTEERIHVLPSPAEHSEEFEATNSNSNGNADNAAPAADGAIALGAAATLASQEALLQALEQTLRQAAERAVDAVANARLGTAVNSAALAIENYGRGRMIQIKERFIEYREELSGAARENFAAQMESETARAEEHLRKRADELIADAAQNAHGEFAGRLSETQTHAATQFAEDASVASAEQLAAHAAQLQVATGDAQQKLESLTARINEMLAESETRLRALQEEISKAHEQGVEQFRERLRSVLNTLLNALR